MRKPNTAALMAMMMLTATPVLAARKAGTCSWGTCVMVSMCRSRHGGGIVDHFLHETRGVGIVDAAHFAVAVHQQEVAAVHHLIAGIRPDRQLHPLGNL